MLQQRPAAAAESYRRRQAMTLATVLAVRALWRRLSGNWQDSWTRDVGPKVAAVVAAGQIALAREADAYMTNVLGELDIEVGESTLRPQAFAGVAPSGDPLDVWLQGAVSRAGQTYNRQAEPNPREALEAGQAWMDQIVSTIMSDAARAAESVALTQRGWVEGYVRMLNPPSCSRCAILAGKRFKWNDGFDRHPGCDCIHIPESEADSTDLRVNPNAYFDSLSRAEQDRIFTNAGAQAVRDGADVGQVVNARSGMATAQQNPRGWIPKGRLVPTDVFGHPTYITTAGTTRRGSARKAMGSGRPVRLMPESIYEIADDRADALRLLKLYGYIT